MQYSQMCGQAIDSKFAPDSSFFIHHDNKKLYIKDCSLELNNQNSVATPAIIERVEISDDSKYVSVYMGAINMVLVYRVNDCGLVAKIEEPFAVSHFWVKNSLQVMVFSDFASKVSIYNLVQGNMCYIKNPKMTSEHGFSFSSDGLFMALLERSDCKDFLSVYCTRDWTIVNRIQLDFFDAAEVKWTPNNANLVVWDGLLNYRLVVHSHMLGQMLKYEPYKWALGIKTVKISNNSLLIAIGSYDEKIRLINGLTFKQICQLDCSNPAINPQKVMVHKQEQSNNAVRMKCVSDKVYRIPVSKVATNNNSGVPNQGVGLLEFSEDNQFLACRNDTMAHTVWVWKMSSLEPYAIITSTSPIKSIKWTKKENYLCIVNGTDRILFWRTNKSIAQCVFTFHTQKVSIHKILWSNDGKKALLHMKNSHCVYAEMIPLYV